MSRPTLDHALAVTMAASEHAWTAHGLIAFYRDIADQMFEASEADEPIDSADVFLWRLKLDTLGNTLTASLDDLSTAMRKSEFSAPLAWGTFVAREGT